MLTEDHLVELLLAILWPVPTFEACPVRTALWCTGLARQPLEHEVMRAAFRLLDNAPRN